ncbi:hypothetical protein TWF106_000674 [Orbilia oligospora]|uniref:C2H2-type domain-containing protein n=1 Tax=Orbilia oligospora TaxID=2813651 RepID=A0A6G1LUA8_ORBOL|nr:hypothetical protein TWF788_000768 [Orbilia oligospora]KAF3206473.1 hypothetical protein TWF106_000674 [Orbilia oligospora]KAF3208054.1 hypothetical protein TWF191_000880 [Orbilia oligospora]KAF3210897.1 hypothetical protein TWF679_006681 [Orbilia oligospora]KAF3233592.1 hypothetical protein TWF192_002081 [Orbilia oligospora]
MMTYSQPSSYSNYDHYHPSASPTSLLKSKPAASQGFYRSPSNATSQANPRTLPPYISLQRASEPASPATIATTISSHSTPSPSPSRPTNMPTTASNTDFTLFDDAMMAVAQDVNAANSAKGRSALGVVSASSSMPENPATITTYAPSAFPIIVSHDVPYSNYAQSAMYGSYSGNYSAPDTTSNFYTLGQDQPASSPQQRQPQTNTRYLRPVSYSNNQNSAPRQRSTSSQLNNEVEPVENVPALSPTKRQANSGYPSGASTCEDQNLSINTWLEKYLQAGSDLNSAMPKLGRTFSDAIQDELYTPEQTRDTYNTSQGTLASPQKKSLDSKHSFPHIFHEAQQQHQQVFSQNGSPQQLGSRDRSPFRHNSPFHPTNHSSMPHAIDQNQLAMALAIGEQMRKEAQQTVAPKTISPRESLLEYQEPESQHPQMGLFTQIQDTGIIGPQDDSMSNGGSLHASSHDGSDLEDFQSMATSRRASMANSTVSSHLDVPRFGYMQQPAFEAITTNPYYYTDANSLGASSLPLSDAASAYLKGEMQRNPITRPLDTSANTGTYTCTFSGCGQRFTTSTKLQKHRREAHRKSIPSGNSVSSAAAIACRNAQPGPHRCMRVNPSTGKPCNTVFSRPYDLTRHEDTIHNTAKAKVRCEICDDDKFFSRSDALVRHRRVKHGIH